MKIVNNGWVLCCAVLYIYYGQPIPVHSRTTMARGSCEKYQQSVDEAPFLFRGAHSCHWKLFGRTLYVMKSWICGPPRMAWWGGKGIAIVRWRIFNGHTCVVTHIRRLFRLFHRSSLWLRQIFILFHSHRRRCNCQLFHSKISSILSLRGTDFAQSISSVHIQHSRENR